VTAPCSPCLSAPPSGSVKCLHLWKTSHQIESSRGHLLRINAQSTAFLVSVVPFTCSMKRGMIRRHPADGGCELELVDEVVGPTSC
jgi:hypothetical protein